MFQKTYRTTAQTGRCVGTMRMPWPFGLRGRAVAAAVGAVCVFALQIRDRRSTSDLRSAPVLPLTGRGLRDAERREESP